MVGSVETMLKLHKDKTPHEQESLQRQIAATDGRIVRLIHESYGLTEKEIRIVER
jgi:primosomal protein N''